MLLALLACATPDAECLPADPEPIDDSLGFRTTEDPGAIAAAIADLPPCLPGEPSDRLDLDRCCADGACVGASRWAVERALGEPSACYGEWGSATRCDWARGISGWFQGGRLVAGPLTDAHYGGRSATGAAMGLSAACFVDELGAPDRATLAEGEGLAQEHMTWYGRGLRLFFVNGEADTLWMDFSHAW